MAKKMTEKVRRKMRCALKKIGVYQGESREDVDSMIDYFYEHGSEEELIEVQKFFTSFGNVPEDVDGKKKF